MSTAPPDGPPPGHPPPPLPEEIARCLRWLEALAVNPAPLAALDDDQRRRLMVAAGRLSRPGREDRRVLSKAFRRLDRQRERGPDEALLSSTGIRTLRRAPRFVTPPALALPAASEPPLGELRERRKCYVCKAEYRQVHSFYDQMCPACADLNWRKRHQTAPLPGRTALVTGARVKIGYQAAILLLRAGARVIVTTRFPRDAAQRYAAEPDFAVWGDRLAIYGLDLRHTPSVERLAQHLCAREERLDFIIHNACQTVRRPPGFYAHLLAGESVGAPAGVAQQLLHDYECLRRESDPGTDPARLSQLPLTGEDRLLSGRLDLFPAGQLDADQQQIDRRDMNSWRLTMAQVPTVELLEVQLVNAIAPFVLTARCKPLMLRHPGADKHVVNVSAMEGQFYRAYKTDKHPHTNMAKAALNMLTRTTAADFVQDGIHMNSVDTGWVTDEDPAVLAQRKVEEHGFHPPLDIVDGAARICDPIFSGFLTGNHAWGQFFKDYAPAPW